MITDPIVEQLHAQRRAYMERFRYDFEAIVQDIKSREAAYPGPLCSLHRPLAAEFPGRAAMAKANRGGWKTCSRGHKYRGSRCPICWQQDRAGGGARGKRAKGAARGK